MPIKGMGVDETVSGKKKRTVKLRKTLAFTHWVEEVKAEKEVEEVSGLDFTGQEQ